VLNPSDAEQPMKLAIDGARLAGGGRLWQMAPQSVDATITVRQKPGVEVRERTLGAAPGAIVVPRFSVNIYSFSGAVGV
jgi:hypothetical protein